MPPRQNDSNQDPKKPAENWDDVYKDLGEAIDSAGVAFEDVQRKVAEGMITVEDLYEKYDVNRKLNASWLLGKTGVVVGGAIGLLVGGPPGAVIGAKAGFTVGAGGGLVNGGRVLDLKDNFLAAYRDPGTTYEGGSDRPTIYHGPPTENGRHAMPSIS